MPPAHRTGTKHMTLIAASVPPAQALMNMCELPETCPSPYTSWYEWYTREAPCSWLGLPSSVTSDMTFNADGDLLCGLP